MPNTQIARVLEAMKAHIQKGHASSTDCALYHLLEKNHHALPELDGRFHKSFRQTDVTASVHEDMAIWHLLQKSHLFWAVVEEIQNEPTP